MSITLYNLNGSPPCRAVRIVARLIGVNLQLTRVNVLAGEQMTPEFLKLNPCHTVPTIADDDFVLWESRAIMRYLVDMYAPNHSLYPKDVRRRAIIDKLLDFDACVLSRGVTDYFYSYLMFGKAKDPEKEEKFKDALKLLETMLGGCKYLAGRKEFTLADISVMTILNVPEAAHYSLAGFPAVKSWYEGMQRDLSIINDINKEGIKEFRRCLQIPDE
ncbi:glutathione S-transferase 1-like [Ornithodoros turicata]|uniref:glutathione S-transferase 1-like n=1 Tax=Ornithodoros turicata TaxID=34597 RepID=UPI00313A3FC1